MVKNFFGKIFYKALFLIFLIILTILFVSHFSNKDYRPKYCDENGCVSKQVFKFLPSYPKNFIEVWNMVYYGRLGELENFSSVPDENYWKQPEFYADSFKKNLYYYTKLKPGYKPGYLNIAGYGPYPAIAVIRDLKQNEAIDVITFWHSSWGVVKYQGIGIDYKFPSRDESKLANIEVEQDPAIARNCFEIKVNPRYFLLEPTYPVFFLNWTQKVKARIKVRENCKPGWYVIHFVPVAPPIQKENEWSKKYLLRYMPFQYVGSAWRVFLNIA